MQGGRRVPFAVFVVYIVYIWQPGIGYELTAE
jgi:hypothetical protein